MPVMQDEQGGEPIKDLGDANLIGEHEIGPNGQARCDNFGLQPTIYPKSRLSTDTSISNPTRKSLVTAGRLSSTSLRCASDIPARVASRRRDSPAAFPNPGSARLASSRLGPGLTNQIRKTTRSETHSTWTHHRSGCVPI
jgi:hypothetical protein